MPFDKDIVEAAEYSECFSERDHSAYKETSATTSDFNHPSEAYVNYIYIDLPAGMMVKTVVDRVVDSDFGSRFKYCSNTYVMFFCLYSRTGRLHCEVKILSQLSISCIYLVMSS